MLTSKHKILAYTLLSTAFLLSACQPESGATNTSTTPANASTNASNPVGNFLEQLGDAVKDGVKQGVDNGIEVSDSVGVLGYTMMPSKLSGRNEPAYCLENPVTRKIITAAPMFGRPYIRQDGTTGFVQTTQQRSKHTENIEVNLNGVLPGNTCQDLIKNRHLTPGVAPSYYY